MNEWILWIERSFIITFQLTEPQLTAGNEQIFEIEAMWSTCLLRMTISNIHSNYMVSKRTLCTNVTFRSMQVIFLVLRTRHGATDFQMNALEQQILYK